MSVKLLGALPTIDIAHVDLNALKNDIVAILTDNISKLIQGSEQDVAEFLTKIAQDYVDLIGDKTITADQRAALITELGNQTMVVAEINRVRAVQEEWETITAIATTVLKVASSMIKFPPI